MSSTTAVVRVPALDGVRGLAILLVMQYHFWSWAFVLAGPQQNALDRWLGRVLHVGWTGVDLFFVLSGFLITGILLDAKHGDHYLRNFWARRILRIAPVYFLFLAFVLLVAPRVPGLAITVQLDELRAVQGWLWTYTVNVAESFRAFDVDVPHVHSHFWSLAVEEQFYLVWPFVVLALGRRPLAWCCVALIAIAAGFRIALSAGVGSSVFSDGAVYYLTVARMDTLAVGALVAVAVREGWLGTLRRWVPAAAAASGAYLLWLFVTKGGLHHLDREVVIAGYTAVAVLGGALIVTVLTAGDDSRLNRALAHPVLRAFGRYSYCLYVIHMLVVFQLSGSLNRRGWVWTVGGWRMPYDFAFSLLATALCFAIAWLSWRLVEQPCLRLKTRFEAATTSAASAEHA